jgi:hypothetical protein
VCQDFCVNGRVLLLGMGCRGKGAVECTKPDPSVPPFGVTLKRSVVNVELQCKEGNLLVSGAGTGFLVAYTDPRLPEGTFFEYLVTNRHVAQCWDEHNHPRHVQSLIIRVNAKELPTGLLHLVRLSGYTNSKCKMTRTLYGGGGSQKCYASYCKFTSDCEEGAVR